MRKIRVIVFIEEKRNANLSVHNHSRWVQKVFSGVKWGQFGQKFGQNDESC